MRAEVSVHVLRDEFSVSFAVERPIGEVAEDVLLLALSQVCRGGHDGCGIIIIQGYLKCGRSELMIVQMTVRIPIRRTDVYQLLERGSDTKGLRCVGLMPLGDLKGVVFTRTAVGGVQLVDLSCAPGPPLILHGTIFDGISQGNAFEFTGRRGELSEMKIHEGRQLR